MSGEEAVDLPLTRSNKLTYQINDSDGETMISTKSLKTIFSSVLGQEVEISDDVPIIDAGLRLESLSVIRVLVEIEKLVGHELAQEDAFEMLSLSFFELAGRLNSINRNR